MSQSARKTKIVATLGPACHDQAGIRSLIEAGADVLRCNTSHLTPESALELYGRIEEVRASCGRNFGVLVDLQGPKLRLGRFDSREVEAGETVWLREDEPLTSHPEDVPVAVESFLETVQVEQHLVLGDANPVLRVEEVGDDRVKATVLESGLIKSRMGVAFPGGGQGLPTITESDLEHLEVAAEFADFVAMSFVRNAQDIRQLREHLQRLGSSARIVAKIERAEALENLEDITQETDAVMVARGDLGVEIGLAEVPFAQHQILSCSNHKLKASITATQVLESMIHSPQPTRAEVSDIAQAIIEGTSALMLSEETAMGDHPQQVVKTMAKIICQVEARLPRVPREVPDRADPRASLVRAADQISADRGASTIIIPTDSGVTVRFASALANQRIIALTPSAKVRQQLALERGVVPLDWDGEHGFYLPITAAACAMESGLVDPREQVTIAWGQMIKGDWIQLVASIPARIAGV